jgi:dipeptidyl aminopeptidase/acylaminoacyl peptidase/CubicO group peptidase (beta-lactamase class C family)
MTRSLTIGDLHAIVTPTDTAISPDGEHVVYVRSSVRDGTQHNELWITSAGSLPRRLSRGPQDAAPRWSPDGQVILFLRRVDGAAQLHRIAPDGGEAEQLTSGASLPLGAGAGWFSADGGRIAFAAPVQLCEHDGPAAAPLVTDKLGYKFDGAGWLGDVRLHLFVLDTQSRKLTRLTDGDWNASEPAWSPDGSLLAFTADLEPGSDLALSRAAYTIRADTPGDRPRRLGSAAGVDAVLFWHAQGSTVIASGAQQTQAGDADLLSLSIDGDPDRILTADLDRSVMLGAPGYPGGRPALACGGKEIIFCLREKGWTHLHAVPVEGGESRALISESNHVVSALSVAASARRASFVLATQTSFGEVATIDLDTGDVTILSAFSTETLPDVEFFAAEEREFEISDGVRVHGWLLADPKTSGPAPLLLDVHGGPHNAWSGVADSGHLYQQELAARGWRILMLNPRGSDGYGRDFMRAIVGAWGEADVADFLEPIDSLIAEGLVDPEQLAVTGYSYGGFTTCSLTTKTNRFRAAVAGGLLCDFAGMGGTSDLGNFLTELAVGSTALAGRNELNAASPITAVDNVSTPTLILHGAQDQRCPLGQAEQWFAALRTRHVTTRMVAYPGASHVFLLNGEVSHRIDYNQRVVDWVERYTRAPGRPRARAAATLGHGYWQRRLDTVCERYGVIGAQFGILELRDGPADGAGGRINTTVVSSGVLNRNTGVPVTDDTLFQIGSITKIWTTILVMQLVDDGLLDLDATVRSVLPDFALADEGAAASITVRHLLNHTSGIDGDLFSDMGRGDDCVERYVASLADSVILHPLGERFSYCNAGFVVAARIVEVLRGAIWDTVLRERIIEPLGLTHTITLAEDAPRFRTAIGHYGRAEEATVPPVWAITRSMGPAGVINTRMADLLVFAEAALRGGTLPGGKRILSEASAAAMLEEQVGLRNVSPTTTAWGLGWFMEYWDGHLVYGHDGATIGQNANLRLFPEHGFALALAVSGGMPDGIHKDLFRDAADAIAGLAPAEGLAPAAGDDVPPTVLGSFETGGMDLEARISDGGPELRVKTKTDLFRDGAEAAWETVPLRPMTAAGVYGISSPGQAGWTQFRPVDGGAYLGYRYVPRKGES